MRAPMACSDTGETLSSTTYSAGDMEGAEASCSDSAINLGRYVQVKVQGLTAYFGRVSTGSLVLPWKDAVGLRDIPLGIAHK